MNNETQITRFVRETLGCNCPDEVFQSIETERKTNNAESVSWLRIDVGNTLLVYISADQEDKINQTQMLQMLAVGRSDRDRNRYNRFRLVLSSMTSPEQEQQLTKVFEQEVGSDEKLHIHWLDKSQLEWSKGC